ncbi:hypothetical protein O7606_20595 [Micromonospora sp. WMMD882]|uniref:hypothetical protein n=1 Tax=Micromonospora sp. WMMD882 TaxID=3015151 RepID=UPI00248BC920|nr:hypothetical protein [Micromonospora sp. WMMD882]WBB78599.1 hypothetical protein O7606_20595 [Micromonospora sp. WMMD882]
MQPKAEASAMPIKHDEGMPLTTRLLWLLMALVSSGVIGILAGLVTAAVTENVEKGLGAGGVATIGTATVSIAAMVFLHGAGPKG